MSDETNCLRCNSFLIAIGLSVIGAILIGFAVFDQSFYGENLYVFVDFIRFTVIGAMLFGAILGSYYGLKGYCLEDKDRDYLVGGILSTLSAIAIIMVIIYFVPMAYDESVLRSIDDLDQRKAFVANEMNCRSILWHYERISFGFDDRKYEVEFYRDWSTMFSLNSEEIDQKVERCKKQ